MTVSLGGFLPFELGEITGKFNHPLEQVHIDGDHDQDLADHDDDLEDHDDDLEDHDDDLFAVSVHPGAHVHETDLHNTFCLSSALGARGEGESGDAQDVHEDQSIDGRDDDDMAPSTYHNICVLVGMLVLMDTNNNAHVES